MLLFGWWYDHDNADADGCCCGGGAYNDDDDVSNDEDADDSDQWLIHLMFKDYTSISNRILKKRTLVSYNMH